MDDDEWIASIDLESLERGMQQQERPGKMAPVVAAAHEDSKERDVNQQCQTRQTHATCRAVDAQWATQHEPEHKCSLHAMSAADLLKGTLNNHPWRQTSDMPQQHSTMPLCQLQQWSGQYHHPQQVQHARHFDPSSNLSGAHTAACDSFDHGQQQPLRLLQSSFGPTPASYPLQQHNPGHMQQQPIGISLPQPHQQQHQYQLQDWSNHRHHQDYLQQQNWQQHNSSMHIHVHQQQPQYNCQQHQQHRGFTRGPAQPEQQQSHHQQPPACQYQPHQAHYAQDAYQPADEIVPRCPYKVCPGVFNFCGADLCYRRRKDGSSGFWSCTTWPSCDFRYFPAQQSPRPELGCEIVDKKTFRLTPQSAAEVAVAKAGGIRAVLAAAGVTLDHLEVKQPAVVPELDFSMAGTGATTHNGVKQQQQQQQQQQQHQQQQHQGDGGILGRVTAVAAAAGAVADGAVEQDAAAAAAAGAAAPDFSWSSNDSMLLRLVDYELVVALLSTAKPPLLGKGGAIPPQTLEAFRCPGDGLADAQEVEERYKCMPLSLQQALLPFQQAGIKFGLGRQGRVLIADEMGVGKTVQALALAACYQDQWPLLVVVPASLRLVWAEEIERWLPHVRPGEVTVIEGREDRLCDLPDANARRREKLPGITITSYEMLKRLSCAACQKLPQGPTGSGGGRGRSGGRSANKTRQCCTGPDHCMAALPWGVVIIDESHNLRTTNSRQADSPHTEAAVAAGSNAKRVILLSGTPSLSRPYDLYRQIDLLVPGLLGRTKEEFAHRYCDRRLVPIITSRGENRLRWNNAGGARLVELHGLLVRRVMIRRLKKDVMAQLPPKRRQVVRLPYPAAHCWPQEQEPGAAAAAAAKPEQQQQQQQQQQKQQQHRNTEEPADDGAGGAAANDEAAAAGVMSAAHRTALAKLPDAIDWLLAALGETSGGSGNQPAAAARSSKVKAPSGPLKPAWKKDSGSSSGSGAGAGSSSSSAAAAAAEKVVDVDDEEDDGGVGSNSSSAVTGGCDAPKFLIFAHHRDVMDKLAAALSGYSSSSRSSDPEELEAPPAGSSSSSHPHPRGVGYVRVDGSHDSTERLTAVQRFRSDPSIRVALLSITAAAVGLDFSSASMVVFVELPTEVSLVRQAEDRAHRKGQCKAVNVYFLCAQGTVDDKRWQALNISLSHVSQVHDGQAETLPEPLARTTAAGAEAAEAEEDNDVSNEGTPVAQHHKSSQSNADEQQQQQQVEGGSEQQQEQQQQCDEDHPVVADPAAAAAAAVDSKAGELCTPTKSTAAAATAGGGGSAADKSPGDLIDLTAASPAAPDSSSRGSSSSKKRKRQSLDFSPTVAAVSKSPAAMAAALAAAAYTPLQVCCKQGQEPSSPADETMRTTAAAVGESNVVVPDVWFEVSGHTNRLHYHLAADGSRPLGMNMPLHWLMMPEEQGSLVQMAAAWDNAQQQQQQQLKQREELQQQQSLVSEQQHKKQKGEQQQRQYSSCTQPGSPGVKQQQQQQQYREQAAARQDVTQPQQQQQQQQCFLSPAVQQKAPYTLQTSQTPPQQQQEEMEDPTAAQSSAAGAGGSSRGTGRGAARPALSSLVLLPFTSPTAAAAAAATNTKTPDGHMGDQGHQQQPGGSSSRSPMVVNSSPALSQRIRRLLQRQDMQQQQQQQGLQHCSAAEDGQPGAAASEQCRCGSLPVVDADVIAATPDSQPQQQQQAGYSAHQELQLLLPPDSQESDQQQQQQNEVTVSSPPGQQLQQQLQEAAPDAEHDQQQQQQHGLDAAAAVAAAITLPDCRRVAGFFGPSGLTCLTLQLTQAQLLELLRLGASFASDWSELRSVTRNRLAGKVVPPDLTAAVEAVTAAAAGSGAFGVGVVRYMKDIQEGDPNLPQGAWLETVTVHYPQGRQPVVKYRQAFTGPTTRHCINCFKAVEGAVLPADAVLVGGLDLFCTAECERAYYIKNSSSGIRRALFKLERGVCVLCGVDAHSLVKQLQQIGKDEPNWAATRKCIVAQNAPRFLERGYATYLDRLINQATEGNAWHADHIVPVYAGGGGCDLDNLRTLCVPCHAVVTKQQAKARAEERARRKLGTRDIRHWFGGTAAAAAAQTAEQGKRVMKPNCVMKRKRRAAVESVYVDDGHSPEINTTTSNQKACRKAARAKCGAVVGGGMHDVSASVDDGDDDLARALKESLQQHRHQQQQTVDVISILSSPSLDTQPHAATTNTTSTAGSGEQQQPFLGVISTPTSAVRSSQQLQQIAATSVVPGPCVVPRAAAAAAKDAAAAAAGSKRCVPGLLSVLNQFKYDGQSSQQEMTRHPLHHQQQGNEPCAAADNGNTGSAAAPAASRAATAAAGEGVQRPCSNSRRAARAAAAAINRQLGTLSCSSDDGEVEHGQLLESRYCIKQQQEHAGTGLSSDVLHEEHQPADEDDVVRKRSFKATASISGKQLQQRKRARGGKRNRSVLDST